jgi:phosphatidylinositol alpha-1,6-mannosyltransferase
MSGSFGRGRGLAAGQGQRAAAGLLLLSPSRGLGGGIERYVAGLAEAVARRGILCERLDLLVGRRSAGVLAKIRFAVKTCRAVATARAPVRVVVAHRDLVPVLRLCAWLPRYAGGVVIVHGREAWSDRHARRNAMLRSAAVQVLAVSEYTAGVLRAAGVSPRVLPPGLTREWFDTLTRAQSSPHDGIELMTAFRLADWRDKGLETIIAAMRLVRGADLRLSVCGSGEPPADLLALIEAEQDVRLFANLDDGDFAEKLASADVFVLATRTRSGRRSSGEGFGMVLLEAQATGTPIIAPASGGSDDAFQPGLTGLAPDDESSDALAAQIRWLLHDPGRLANMGRAAARWSRSRFDPDAYADMVAEAVLDEDGLASTASSHCRRQ